MPEPSPQPHDPTNERDDRTGRSASAMRAEFQSQWVEEQLRVAMERGDFDNLPGAGKPIEGLGDQHDPNWWLKKLIEREKLSVLPPALGLRKEDADLADTLDLLTTEQEVRRELDDFNARVRRARMQLQGGPPVITAERDLDDEVAAWRGRREAQRTTQRAAQQAAPGVREQSRHRRWGWRRRR